jgi:isoquinoline 1-oxidoreductase beta subunit
MSKSTKKKGITRRKFLAYSSLGLGVILGAGYLSRGLIRRYLADIANAADLTYGGPQAPTLWFEVTADNQVLLHSPKVEMGQGTFTGMAQIAADELSVSLEQLQVIHASSASGNLDPFATGGSNSISSLWQPLREIAATMREMLKAEAATLMGLAVSDLQVENGVISSGERSMTYGEVVAQAQSWTVPDQPPLREVSSYRWIGQPVPRIDLRDKVLGTPMFGMDATLPDMLYGSVVRPRAIGATYQEADVSRAEQMPGVVKVVQAPDFVGVVATSRMAAEAAKQAIEVTWKTERSWQQADIEAMIEVGKGNPVEIQLQGDPEAQWAEEAEVIQAEYRSPIGAHAQMEPNGAVAFVEADRATILMSTQVVGYTRQEVAQRLGFDEAQVTIQPTYLGGGFGRRLHTPNAVQAAVLSQAVGKPVKCFFTREEEFRNDTFRPPTHHVLKARLGSDGRLLAMEHNLSSGDVMFGSPLLPRIAEPILGADVGAWRGGMIQYGNIPHHRAVSWRIKLPFATSWWRSLGLLANTFAIESFMDELALKAGQDPVQFRLAHIQDDGAGRRLRAVIEAAAERSGYRDEVVDGRAMGFAASTDANTPVAQVVEVSMAAGQIKVHKVTCVIDPGMAINPDQIRAQCEGAIIMGLSAALYEQMTVQDNELVPSMYGPYRMALMKDAPREIDVVILENADAPGGVGEPPLGPIGAAIANAVFRLTGERRRAMPLS